MEFASVSPLQLGYGIAGFGVIAWFVLRRRKLGPIPRGAMVGYAALLGCSAGVIGYVLTNSLAVVAVVAIIVGAGAFIALRRP
jgi:hypothetical protein